MPEPDLEKYTCNVLQTFSPTVSLNSKENLRNHYSFLLFNESQIINSFLLIKHHPKEPKLGSSSSLMEISFILTFLSYISGIFRKTQ